MNTFEIYKKIIEIIELVLSKTTGEVNIVKESIDEIEKTKCNWPSNIKVNTGFCHQKPYAFFVNPNILFTKSKTELGDFLFVIKYIDNKVIIDNRALFLQAKYNSTKKSDSFKIDLHQFHFYKQINNIVFKFGKTVDKSLTKPKIWKNISKPYDFGDYLLLGCKYVYDLYTSEIAGQYEHKKKGYFRFNFDSNINNNFLYQRHLFYYFNFYSPLFYFLTPFGKGNKIEGQFKEFINLIYKKLGMKIDPPEENEGFWIDSNGGFGLVEIVIDNENFGE